MSAIQAILDSGTSCLVVPDDTFGGGLLASPFKMFQKHFGDLDEPTIHITIEGKTFSLPYDDYMVDDKPCVMKMKSTPRTFLLGDVFFRRMVVSHNLNDPSRPQITLGQRNPDYKLTTIVKKVGDRSHVPLGKKAVQKPMPETEDAVPSGSGQAAPVRVGGDSVAGAQANVAASVNSNGGMQTAQGTQQQAAMWGQQQPMYQQLPPQQQQPMIVQQPQYNAYAQLPYPGAQAAGVPNGYMPMGYPPQQQPQQPAMVQPSGVQEYQMNQPHFAPQYHVASSTGEVYLPGAAGVGAGTGTGTGLGAGVQPQGVVAQQPMQSAFQGQGRVGRGESGGQQGLGAAVGQAGQEPPPLHNPSAGARRLLGSTTDVQRVPMTTSNSYIYYASLEVSLLPVSFGSWLRALVVSASWL